MLRFLIGLTLAFAVTTAQGQTWKMELIDEFPSPVQSPAFALGYDSKTKSLWGTQNGGDYRVWNFDFEGNVLQSWPHQPAGANLIGLAVDGPGQRVFSFNNFQKRVFIFSTDGTPLGSTQVLPHGYINSTGRIGYDPGSNRIILPYTGNSAGPSGFVNISLNTGLIVTTEEFDFLSELGIHTIMGFVVTPGRYWVLGPASPDNINSIFEFDRATLKVVNRFEFPEFVGQQIPALAIAPDARRVYLHDWNTETIKVYERSIVPIPTLSATAVLILILLMIFLTPVLVRRNIWGQSN